MTHSRWTACAALAICLVAAVWRPMAAQDSPIPAEVAALFDDIADIDKLRVLNPLKLTSDEIDRLIVTIQKSQQAYNAALAEAAVPPIKGIAQDIKDTRQKMLSGATIPNDLDERVKKLQSDFVSRRNAQDANTLRSLAASIRDILTPDQYSRAVALARRDLTKDDKPTARGTDDKFFNYYVLHVFIQFPRIVPLLQDMKKAQGGAP